MDIILMLLMIAMFLLAIVAISWIKDKNRFEILTRINKDLVDDTIKLTEERQGLKSKQFMLVEKLNDTNREVLRWKSDYAKLKDKSE